MQVWYDIVSVCWDYSALARGGVVVGLGRYCIMQSHIGAVGFFVCFSSGSMKDLGGTPARIYGSAQLKCSEGPNAVMGCVMEKKSASKDFYIRHACGMVFPAANITQCWGL